MKFNMDMRLIASLKKRVIVWLSNMPPEKVVFASLDGEEITAKRLIKELDDNTDFGKEFLDSYLQTALRIGLNEIIKN